jgi:hypothetical protein
LANTLFSGTFTPGPGYDCSGQTIEARRLSMGRYEVRFTGSPSTQALATASVSGIEAYMTSVQTVGPGQFVVYVLSFLPAPGGQFIDIPFTMITV